MDEELIGQLRDISGGAYIVCDLCGLPHTSATIIVIAGRRSSAEPIEEIRACAACRRLIEAGELPFDAAGDAEALVPDEE